MKESVTTDHREKEKEEVRPQRHAVCNVLATSFIGTEVSLLSIKGNGTFRNLIFEGFVTVLLYSLFSS